MTKLLAAHLFEYSQGIMWISQVKAYTFSNASQSNCVIVIKYLFDLILKM